MNQHGHRPTRDDITLKQTNSGLTNQLTWLTDREIFFFFFQSCFYVTLFLNSDTFFFLKKKPHTILPVPYKCRAEVQFPLLFSLSQPSEKKKYNNVDTTTAPHLLFSYVLSAPPFSYNFVFYVPIFWILKIHFSFNFSSPSLSVWYSSFFAHSISANTSLSSPPYHPP